MRVLKLFLFEAVESLGRGWRLALPALITIASAVAVVGAFLTASATAGRVLAAWSETAELSVFLDAGIVDAARARVEAALRDAPAVAAVGCEGQKKETTYNLRLGNIDGIGKKKKY